MKSNGGAMLARGGRRAPDPDRDVRPAGGMIAASARRARWASTTAHARHGRHERRCRHHRRRRAAHTTEFEIEWGLPAAIPLIDIKSIGAGGGSIAWMDAGGFLRVGPRSAGRSPVRPATAAAAASRR